MLPETLKRFLRAVVPGPLRQRIQRRKLDRLVQDYQRRVVEHRYGDINLRIELADPLAAGWYDHDWPPLPELALLARHQLRLNARVFDLGAHQGIVGLMLAHHVGREGQVILVEPNPHNISLCGRNSELNGVNWTVPLQAAVTDHEGVLPINAGWNGQAFELSDYGGPIEVPCLTVDAITARYGSPQVVFVDVEGYECKVLAGARETFATQPDWFIEVHIGHGLEAAGGSVNQVLSYFPDAEYERFVHSEGDSLPIRLSQAPAHKLRDRFFLTVLARRARRHAPHG